MYVYIENREKVIRRYTTSTTILVYGKAEAEGRAYFVGSNLIWYIYDVSMYPYPSSFFLFSFDFSIYFSGGCWTTWRKGIRYLINSTKGTQGLGTRYFDRASIQRNLFFLYIYDI